MANNLKHLKVYGIHGPNSAKVPILCEELGLPYETDPIALTDVKNPEYVAINPNGRLPAIQDPNTDLTLGKSGAICEYLTENYDTAHKLSFQPGTDRTTGNQMWFIIYQPLPEARERYVKEVDRVTGVLKGHLAKQKPDADGNIWFLDGRLTYLDIAFFTWQNTVELHILDNGFKQKDYPHVQKWLSNMLARPSVKNTLESQSAK